jgi:hypothetical protein
MVERALDMRGDDVEYNDLAPWNYSRLPEAFGCRDWTTAKVNSVQDLDAALAEAGRGGRGFYIEVMGGRTDFPKGLQLARTRLAQMYGDGVSDGGSGGGSARRAAGRPGQAQAEPVHMKATVTQAAPHSSIMERRA